MHMTVKRVGYMVDDFYHEPYQPKKPRTLPMSQLQAFVDDELADAQPAQPREIELWKMGAIWRAKENGISDKAIAAIYNVSEGDVPKLCAQFEHKQFGWLKSA